jgi:asparagine synthetase B (glutamine-hydrolysing)
MPGDPAYILDPLVNAVWAASWGLFPDNRTFLAGVTILPRGHYACLDGGKGEPAVRPYWDPCPARVPYPTPAQAAEHAERLRTLLIAKLTRDLHPDPSGGNLLTLSGGVDSSSLGALAAGVVGRKVWTLTVLPSKENAARLEHELSFIAPLAEEFGLERRWEIHFHERQMLDLWRSASPIVFHVIHPALCSLPRVVREAPVRVLFGGEFADEVCGSKFTIPDWARHTSPFRLLLDPIESATLDPFVPMNWEACSALGIRRSLPFFNREVFELATDQYVCLSAAGLLGLALAGWEG